MLSHFSLFFVAVSKILASKSQRVLLQPSVTDPVKLDPVDFSVHPVKI